MSAWSVIEADCIEAMRAMDACSVDAVVCDPPYGLEFMGKDWDRLGATTEGASDSPGWRAGHGGAGVASKTNGVPFGGGGQRVRYGASARSMQAWHEAWAREALRVLKPGGHLLAFGGTRTYHRLACAVEDAGFEIRDSIADLSTPRSVQLDLLREWIAWTERVPHAGLRLLGQGADSVPAPVLLGTSLENSPVTALIAELRSSEAHRTDAASWRSALSGAGEPSTGSSALVTIAGNSPASPDPKLSDGSTAHGDALGWLAASTEARTRAAEALRIWRGSGPSSKRAATDALCAALTDALRVITCAQSRTFQSYDTTLRTVCASATTATTTASTAASLIAFTADTLERLGGDASEVSTGPLLWVYGSGFPPSKSLDVSKAIDAQAGAVREVVGRYELPDVADGRRAKPWGLRDEARQRTGVATDFAGDAQPPITAPATPDAERWQGWGTALKPAHEPIVVARKPLSGAGINVLQMVEFGLREQGVTEEIRWTHGRVSDAAKRGRRASSSSTDRRSAEAISADPAAAPEMPSAAPPTASKSAPSTKHGATPIESTSAPTGVTPADDCASKSLPPMAMPAPAVAKDSGNSSPSTTSTAAEQRTERLFTARSTSNSDEKDSLPATESFAGIATGLTGSRAHVRISRLSDGTFSWPDGLPEFVPGGPTTVAATVLEHGTGALNVDGCRIGTGEGKGVWPVTGRSEGRRAMGGGPIHATETDGSSGRWPANVVLDPEAAAMLDEQTGELPAGVAGASSRGFQRGGYVGGANGADWNPDAMGYGDPGGASRFFYVAKASSAERNAGLDGFPERDAHTLSGGEMVADGRTAVKGKRSAQNVHPTVKPIDLMRWLVRLVTPPGGVVLDPFAGSGTTGIAATLEGFRFVGIEREPEYAEIARARIAWWAKQGAGISTEAALRAGLGRDVVASSGQSSFDLFGDAA